LKQFAGNTPLDNTSKTYIIRYRLQDGRFYALSFKEKYAELSEGKGEEKE